MRGPGLRVTDLTTYPVVEPVTLAELKAHCRVLTNADDQYFTSLLTTIRLAVENYCRIALVPKTLMLSMDRWPTAPGTDNWWDGVREGDLSLLASSQGVLDRQIVLPYPPLLTVSAFSVYDDNDVAATQLASSYYVDAADNRRQGRIVLRRGAVWIPVLRVANGIQITFTCGYGGSGPAIPQQLKNGMMLLGQYLYRNRGDAQDANLSIGPSGASTMIADYQDLER